MPVVTLVNRPAFSNRFQAGVISSSRREAHRGNCGKRGHNVPVRSVRGCVSRIGFQAITKSILAGPGAHCRRRPIASSVARG